MIGCAQLTKLSNNAPVNIGPKLNNIRSKNRFQFKKGFQFKKKLHRDRIVWKRISDTSKRVKQKLQSMKYWVAREVRADQIIFNPFKNFQFAIFRLNFPDNPILHVTVGCNDRDMTFKRPAESRPNS